MRGNFRILALVAGVLAAVAAAWPSPADAQQAPRSVGEVRVSRDAVIRRAGAELVANIGLPLVERDLLVTGPSGVVAVVLNDNTVITIGPSSVFQLTEFTFEPEQNRFGLLGEIYFGTLEYISGKISEMARDAARFRTPYTTVAARGTRLLVRADP